MSNLNWVDNVFLAIFFISAIAGLMRGLVKEVISLITWVAAFVVASLFATPVAQYFTSSQSVQSVVSSASSAVGSNAAATSVSMLSVGISYVILFVVTLIVGSIFNYILSKAVEGQGISFFNRLLGAVFGLARGFLLVLIVVFLVQMTALQQQPWWTQSQLVPSFQPAVTWLNGIVQPSLESLKAKVNDAVPTGTSVVPDAKNMLQGIQH